jgi:hypothetical protein
MDATASAGWNDWCLAIVRNEIGAAFDALGAVLGEEVANTVTGPLVTRIKQLEAELAALRADFTIERSAARGIVDLANWRAPKAS